MNKLQLITKNYFFGIGIGSIAGFGIENLKVLLGNDISFNNYITTIGTGGLIGGFVINPLIGTSQLAIYNCYNIYKRKKNK